MGNLRSVQKGFERIGAEARIVRDADAMLAADKIVLPGVGAFADAMTHLRQQSLIEPLVAYVASGKPFLGICLGLQLIFDVGYEDGEYPGLGILPGKVVRFDFGDDPAKRELKVPHMGWNVVDFEDDCPLLRGLTSGAHFYFVHSYHGVPKDPGVIAGSCDYGGRFAAVIWRDNLYATQFHPEKSQKQGLRILENYATL